MTTERMLMVIADIGGYTDYIRTHRMSLAHAQVNTARLLERVIDAAPGFDLIEIEGDAAFVARPVATMTGAQAVSSALDVAALMHRAFHVERRYVATVLCPCKGCTEAGNLRLKFVAHVGEVATQTIRDRRKLVGIDVIQLHRMLKNSVRMPEYVLLSEELYAQRDGDLPVDGEDVEQDLDGIGRTRSHAVDVSRLVGPVEVPKPSLATRLGRTLGVAGAGLPGMLRFRRAAAAG